MKMKVLGVLSLLSSLALFSAPAHAQCKDKQDQFCRNLQYILYAAQTDFGPFRGPQQYFDFGLFHNFHPKRLSNLPNPDVSLGPAKVPCQMSNWMNGVAVYMCEGQLAMVDGEQWYTKAVAELKQLQYLWQFKIDSPGANHFVDAGPQDCDVAVRDGVYIAEGPYSGQCPLHLQTVRQADGTNEVHLWVTSYTSPFLARRLNIPSSLLLTKSQGTPSASASPSTMSVSVVPVASTESASKPAEAAATKTNSLTNEPSTRARAGCDELCQGLKKILEGRWTSFKELNVSTSASSSTKASIPTASIKLVGASCSIHGGPAPAAAPATHATAGSSAIPVSRVRLAAATSKSSGASPPNAPAVPVAPAQYVCYWTQDSGASAETQFHELISLLEVIIPSTWSVQQQNQADEMSGLKVTAWTARDASEKRAIALYLGGQSVGLHVTAAEER